jgi:hypothetical protein
VGGVLTLKSFQDDFGITAAQKSDVSSLSASLLQAGGEQALVPFPLALAI